jgi:hypothetical protein
MVQSARKISFTLYYLGKHLQGGKMATPEEATTRIESRFAAGSWKVELEPDEVKNWHEIHNLLSARGYRHINMNATTTATIKPYAINAAHRKNPIKVVMRMFSKLVVPKAK